MTDREKYRLAFGVLHASGKISLEAEMRTFNFKKAAALCLAAVLICALAVTAYAYGASIYGWGGNMEILANENEHFVVVHTDDLKEPVVFEDGRMIFIVNGEHIDITDTVTYTEAYRYRYIDNDGYIHDWLIGLNGDELENYGYAEYISTKDGNWQGGYSARVNGSTVPWLDNAKAEMDCPW